jgi:hypothetical protein
MLYLLYRDFLNILYYPQFNYGPGINRNINLDNSRSKATGCKLNDRGSIPDRRKNFSSRHHNVQTGSEAHPAVCPMSTGCSFLGDKVARA